jgi:hypothetical protein
MADNKIKEIDINIALSKLAATAMTSRLIKRNTSPSQRIRPPCLNPFTDTLHFTELKAVQTVVPQSNFCMKFFSYTRESDRKFKNSKHETLLLVHK